MKEVRELGVRRGEEKRPARSFKDLIVWQKAHCFVLKIFEITDSFPKSETYGLSMQFRRAAVSIAANIAEGFRRKSKVEKKRFLNIAQASVAECEYYVLLTKDLGFTKDKEIGNNIEEVSRLLNAYERKIEPK